MSRFERLLRDLIERGDLDFLVVEDLKFVYTKCLDKGDWETKDALRKVLKYYLSTPEYKEFLKEVGIESNTDSG